MIFKNLDDYGCEEIIFFWDKKTKLKAIVAIYDTILGPAFGGTRLKIGLWPGWSLIMVSSDPDLLLC